MARGPAAGPLGIRWWRRRCQNTVALMGIPKSVGAITQRLHGLGAKIAECLHIAAATVPPRLLKNTVAERARTFSVPFQVIHRLFN